MLTFIKAGERHPVIWPPVSKGPVEMPAGRRQCGAIGGVIAPFSEPARKMCRIAPGVVVIGITAECPIRVLHAQQPPNRTLGGNAHVLVTRLTMPCRQSMQYLTGIEGRWGNPVMGDLEPREAAFRQLHGQQELHCPFGAFVEPGLRQNPAQGEKGRYDVARCSRIRAGPSASELVTPADPAVRL